MSRRDFAFTVKRNPNLPRLSWLCVVRETSDTVELTCGADVEIRKRFFVEGCWAGEFADGLIETAESVFGSGGAIAGPRAVFVPASATTDCLFYRHDPPVLMVSNSLAFLLAASCDELEPSYDGYDRDNQSIVRGIDGYVRPIKTRKGGVWRLMYRNLVFENGVIREEDKVLPPPFPDFDSYYKYLRDTVCWLIRNARSVDRRVPLGVATTQSRGYDTTAVNALVAEFGVDVAFTCSGSKGKGRFADADADRQAIDDGTEIAKRLGISCKAIDRRRFEKPFQDEYLYFAALDAPQDFNLVDVNELIQPPSLLLTGTLGELWYPKRVGGGLPGYSSPDLQRWDLGCHGLSEIRLQVGFVQCAVPYIGARRRGDITRITESAEMLPWSVGGDYDRPIPRRIAESAGVSREMFGQVKMASVVEFVAPRVPVTPELRQEYFEFLAKHRILGPLGRAILSAVWAFNTWLIFHPHRYYLERVLRHLMFWRQPSDGVLLMRALNGRTFCFGVNKRIKDYAVALGASMVRGSESTNRPD